MSGNAFTASLIGKTNPSPYDQVILLSQDMINKAFRNMWLLSAPKKGQPAPPLRAFQKSIRRESVDIKLSAPTVKLMVTTRQDPQLFFMMNMESGTFVCYKDTESDDTEPIQFKRWTFGFPVKIGSKVLTKDDPQFTNAVTNAGFSSDVYSLAQLYLDVSSSTAFNDKYNNYGNFDWSKRSAENRASFEIFVQKWFKDMQGGKHTVIGYALQAKKATPDHATFPPTSIDYYVYPWLDPAESSPAPTDDSPSNALCYLMMSRFAKPPSVPGLEYSGAFVQTGGLLTMRSSLFWDQWLIPLLQGINKGAEIIPDLPVVRYDASKGQWPWHVSMEFHVGVSGGHSGVAESAYAFSRDASRARGWKWRGAERVKTNSATDGGSRKQTVTQKSTTSTTLTFDEGGQSILLNGKTVFEFQAQFFRNGKTSGKASNMVITTDWHFKMALSSVNDGGVQLARVPEPAGEIPCRTTVQATQGDVKWKRGFDAVKQSFSGNIGNYIDKDTHDIQNALLTSLEGQEKLFLPASGAFLMRDPKFNARGDLLVTLDYNGTDPPDAPTASDVNTSNLALMAFKSAIDGPVSFNPQGRLHRIAPTPVPELAVRSVGVEVSIAA